MCVMSNMSQVKGISWSQTWRSLLMKKVKPPKNDTRSSVSSVDVLFPTVVCSCRMSRWMGPPSLMVTMQPPMEWFTSSIRYSPLVWWFISLYSTLWGGREITLSLHSKGTHVYLITFIFKLFWDSIQVSKLSSISSTQTLTCALESIWPHIFWLYLSDLLQVQGLLSIMALGVPSPLDETKSRAWTLIPHDYCPQKDGMGKVLRKIEKDRKSIRMFSFHCLLRYNSKTSKGIKWEEGKLNEVLSDYSFLLLY